MLRHNFERLCRGAGDRAGAYAGPERVIRFEVHSVSMRIKTNPKPCRAILIVWYRSCAQTSHAGVDLIRRKEDPGGRPQVDAHAEQVNCAL